MIKSKYTFWELITKYCIEIPKIQRDYVQGRKDKEIEKIAGKFLDDIVNCISNSKELNLDFVYGKVENNTLVPLDGQQRLTTLFLIHWYLALKENKLSDEVKKTLLKFKYETRISSEDFCKTLVDENIDYNAIDKNISDAIVDSKWYFLSWERDPTVSSMLNMLDKIHDKFRNLEEGLFEQLITKDIITFHFLPLKEFKLSDELYIKMNARGKPLTAFETFKANFSGYLKTIEQRSKLDNEWLDIFWNLENNKNAEMVTERVDERFLNFFTNITLNFYVEKNDIVKSFIDDYDISNIYEIVYENEDYINSIVSILDSLAEYSDEESIFFDFLKSNRQINYWERLRFYVLCRFFIKFGKVTNDNERTLKRWLRVTDNLIKNTRVESTRNYIDGIHSINELSNNIDDIYNYISSSPDKIKYFSKLQRLEESLKAKLIQVDENWENVFIKIEKHSYFDGQIGFIMEYSKKDGENYDKSIFEKYSASLSELFSDNFKENYDFLFQRALLVKGDYLPQIGSDNYTFCTFDEALRTKLDNWRKVFNDKEKTLFLKGLLDSINEDSLIKDLQNVIKEHEIGDWRQYIINNPNYIFYCTNRHIRWYSENKIYLLSKTQMNGRHVELYSWDLFKRQYENKSFLPFKSKPLYSESTSREPPYIVIKGFKFNDNSFAIDLAYKEENKYYLKFYDENDVEIPNSIAEILEDLDFKENEIILSKNELQPKIYDLCKKLKDIIGVKNA
ncbi:MAG TPA: DUF262 domain-containing protein [Candidatus Glassbacteria bacterium]|nr:DUF262 domain-containing protein [Candidatus Glassbacteria bacterium]